MLSIVKPPNGEGNGGETGGGEGLPQRTWGELAGTATAGAG